ncbi:MAG: GyrI-like domain-containing protein [Anaerolineales bacterium]|nr:GyrI-like domain-containing protein [Anaerolineales bacterium]
MITLDLRKQYKHLYQPSAKKVELVEVPRFNFLMADGVIEPGLGPGASPLFQEAMQALYGASYTLKFMSKQRRDNPIDYPVMALEGLWWVADGEFSFSRKDNWAYTVMIMQPDHVTAEMFAEALQQLRKKKGDQPGFARLRLESFAEGRCIQVMHLGPYTTEPETIARMDGFALENGLTLHGKHHEIYLGDPMRAQPEKLKTVLRHPVKQAGA